MIQILQGDCRDVLKTLPDCSVHCCVTSPPYWGLRDYGVEGQIGLEKTPEEYVSKMVEVFREVKRVLRDDGTVFLNIGDSYYGSSMTGGKNSKEGSAKRVGRMFEKPSGVQRATSCGISGKAPANCQDHDCLYGNLCGVCREVYRRISRNYDLLYPMLIASLSVPTRESMGFVSDHSPTSDSSHLGDRIFPAIQDLLHCEGHAAEQLHAFRESMPDEFSRQLLDLCWQRGNSSACLLCGRSLACDALASSYRLDGFLGQVQRNRDNALHVAQQAQSSQCKDKACVYCGGTLTTESPPYVQPYRTINQSKSQLKPKDLVGIPWRVAFALQADGWYLRQDIIWHKPNPMPESVTDRCTKAHEYIFLLAKSPRYYYDAEAVKEKQTESTVARAAYGWNGRTDDNSNGARTGSTFKRMAESGEKIGTIPADGLRNKRSVWTVSTKPYREAHFATFPPDLIQPCIRAGCPAGGTVLDPFGGSGTTGEVAASEGRKAILIELNPQYVKLAQGRGGLFCSSNPSHQGTTHLVGG